MEVLKVIYQVFLLLVRVGTNAFAVPVWAGVVGIGIGMFGSDPFFEAIADAFVVGFEWSFTTPAGWIVAGVFAVLGLIHGIRMWIGESYLGVGGFFGWLFDHTWSLPNTIVGSVFAVITLGIDVDKSASKNSSRLVLKNGLVGSYDTTFGNVTAGTQVPKHELVHVIQARVTGPFYYPVFVANYVLNLVPLWWLLKLAFNIYPNSPIDSFARYFTRGVYPFTLFELIAYAVEGEPP